MKGKISTLTRRILDDEQGRNQLTNIMMSSQKEGTVTLKDGTKYIIITELKAKVVE